MNTIKTSRQARGLFKKVGWSLFVFTIFFELVRELSLSYVAGTIWKYTLKTTPDGYISNANLINTLIHCPWIVIVAIFIVLLFALLSSWQAIATFIDIAYIYEGKRITLIDLIKQSLVKLIKSFRPKNWSILLYSLLIVPFANVYQVSSAANAFIIPEYIQDFIDSKTSLVFVSALLTIIAFYMSLRWLFVLPSFVLRKNSFVEARKESYELSRKGLLKNGIKVIIYNAVENLRLAIIPLLMLTVTIIVLLIGTAKMTYSFDVIISLGTGIGGEFLKGIIGSLLYISTMCYLFSLYVNKLKIDEKEVTFELPELEKYGKKHHSIAGIEFIFGIIISLFTCLICVGVLFVAKESDDVILAIFAPTKIVAHKGYSSLAPENTMPAFELADKSNNVDFIELDVWNSKDGIPVVIHNETIYDATGLEGNIYDYTYEELCDISAPYTKDRDKFKDARIPSLEEVLSTYASSTPILIEIKGYQKDESLVRKIVDLMDKYDCLESSMIHSGDYSALKAVKEINPDIKCGLIQAIVSGDCYDLPYVDFISVEHTFVNRDMVSNLHTRGKQIYVWTVNYESSAKALKMMDVDGIITDYPDDIAEYVKAHNNLVNTALERIRTRELDLEYNNGNY